MKRVLLLGDSIRLSYEADVRDLLYGEAIVLGTAENGMHTTNLLMRLDEWAVRPKVDVIHVNAGLWDVRRVVWNGAGNVVPPACYRENVRAILETLTRETAARVVWATTTPVVQARVDRTWRRLGGTGRSAADVPAYNAIAVEEARRLGVAVNDLYAAAVDAGVESVICDDGTHFTPAGARMLAERVADAVRGALAQG